MKVLHMVAFVLVVVGGINWLLFAFGWNLVSATLGAGSTLAVIVYVLIGLSAIFEAVTHSSRCRMCGSGAAAPMMQK